MSTTVDVLMSYSAKIGLGPREISRGKSFSIQSIKPRTNDDHYPDILVKQEGDTILYITKLMTYSELNDQERLSLFENLLLKHFGSETFVHYSINSDTEQVYIQVTMPNTETEEIDHHLFLVAHTSLCTVLKLYISGDGL